MALCRPLFSFWHILIPLLVITQWPVVVTCSYDGNDVIEIKSGETEINGEGTSYREFSIGKGEKGLFPNIFNLATHAEIRATASCGQQGPEYYCKLVEHVFMRQPQCDICDANNHLKNHPIDYAIDGTRRFWMSPTLSNGLIYEKVNITLDLRQEYQVAYVVIKAAISPRPGTWVLEKSLDGVNYEPWQYFAMNEPECMRKFGVPATVGVPRFANDDDVICTSYFSKLNPLENGEVHVSLVNGRPGSDRSTPELQAFTRARYVRLRLIGLRTLYADLMIINQRDKKLDHSVTRRYFYSISDISIGGQCICYGHAETCPPDVTHGQFRCECSHNTCGESCSECCPLFNQLPWRFGTHDHPNICQPCQCFNHASRCVYDEEIERQRLSVTPEGIYEGGGRCIDCRDNTDGINCEKCKSEYYRPANISHYRHDACHPCDCDPLGSESNQCIRDETEATNGLRPGDCLCKPGFGGRRCDRCAIGYRNHPVCEPCPCNQAGSLNFETCEEAKCSCKTNVEGEFCDVCKPGTIYLDKDNPLGCQPCFCFGITKDCREFSWITGQISFNFGWNLTDLHGHYEAPVLSNNTELLIFNTEDYGHQGHSIYYWKAPQPLLGNLLNSYGSILHYFVYFVPKDNGVGHPLPVADIIIEGNGAKLEYYSRLNFFPRENISVNIPLKQSENWYDARTRRPVDKTDLMRVLADVTRLLIRARYHQDQLQSSIYGLRLETALDPAKSAGPVGMAPAQRQQRIHPVEVCECPDNFEGNSCERCSVGFRRVNNQLYDGTCKRCECQGHSEQCDPFTGYCLNCRHNTTGARCEHCVAGYYGNPSLGGELGQCKPCACPTVMNSHSALCALSQLVFEGAAAAHQDEYVCTACEAGYDGNKCEECADGYFGDPYATDPALACRPCLCSGNIDAAAIGNCDRTTGQCLRCIGHTTGESCELCEDNHWGSALAHNCRPCKCHHLGSVRLQCSNETGKCECKEGYTGNRCDRCVFGHGDIENFCPECLCNSTGSLGVGCDEVSGQCSCKKGVFGKRCDMCLPSYHSFGSEGCQFCHCNEWGAIAGKECHNITGECQCQPNVVGQKCEQCVDGFFNLTSGIGCQPCECNTIGSESILCDVYLGQCRCKPGVTGLKCDKCEPNHYGFGDSGCKRCQVCPAPGQVCDSITGECVCPPNTQGEVCEQCTQNAWNYHPYRGCELCECDGIGADSSICNAQTGQCKCKSGYVGHRCDMCEPGYFKFPDCEPCNCNLAGTEPSECRGPQCLCTNEGQCKCKKFVTGLKCDQCASNAFSLETSNPNGCTDCFCFDRTNKCTQSRMTWRQIYAPDRHVRFDDPFELYTRRHNIHILKEWPLNYNSYPTNHTPLYWPLPQSFLGDRTNSYNGFIRFVIRNDDNYRGRPNVPPLPHTFKLFSQVLLIGNNRLELEHIPDRIGGEDGKYKVRLHESQWRNRVSPQLPLTRRQMMIALQNVQAIYVRGSYNELYRGDSISINELSLDVASENASASKITGDEGLSIGVEQCEDCAEGWTGLSCQNPAIGFFRRRDPDYLNIRDDMALVGMSVPCACHGHSASCDPETGRCHDCGHNTIGDFCEICQEGYYGRAMDGTPDSCHRCACPLPENSFSPTCRQSQSAGRGYICDACRPGYTGHYCENCMAGYYGDPSAGGYCAPCSCHPHGSLHAVCHNITGYCECREGVEGRDCSVCRPRHAFLNGVCTSCDRGCYKALMRMEDEMEYALGSVRNLSDVKPIPRKRLGRISAAVQSLNALLDSIRLSETDAEALLDGVDTLTTESKHLKHASLVEQEFNLLSERNADLAEHLTNLEQQLNQLRDLARSENSLVKEIAAQLAQFSQRSAQTPAGQLDYLVVQAQSLLGATRERDAIIEKRFNYAKKNAEDAERLLRDVLSKKLNRTLYEHLAGKHAEYQTTVRDFRNILWDVAKAGSASARNLSQQAAAELVDLERIIEEIKGLRESINGSLSEAGKGVGKISAIKEALQAIYNEIEDSLLPALRSQKDNEVGNGEYSEISLIRDTRMPEADRHTADLERHAQNLKSQFSQTQVISTEALAASNAYNDIIETLTNATQAAKKAKHNAEDAFNVVDPLTEGSLVSLANSTLTKSSELNRQLDETLNELVISETNTRMQKALDSLGAVATRIEKNVTWIKDIQQQLDDHHDRINTVYSTVEEAHAGLGAVEENVIELNEAVKELKQRSDVIHIFTQQSLREDMANLSLSGASISEVEKALEDVRKRTDQHAAQFKRIRTDLGVLKEKINEAREKASKVRIGVRGEPGAHCVREYISPMRPSASNTISLKYRPAMDSPDSLLFFTQIKSTRTQGREYIAIELKSKKIHVKWDIGLGYRDAEIIKRNIVYIPTSDRYTWYHIEIKRVANTMYLSVVQKQTMTGEGSRNVDEPTTVTRGEPDVNNEVIFNTVPEQTRISVGHRNQALIDELGLATSKFHGTIGELTVDGVSVPLWVFDSSYGHCDGATGPPTPIASGHMFRDGFAQVRMPMAERANTMITVQFSAYSPNGLLYFRGSPSTGDFIALELWEGAVAVKANFGADAKKIALQSNGSSYADGRVHKIRVIRNQGEVHLQIDPDGDHVSIAMTDAEALLNIPESDHFVGGVPPEFPRHRFTVDHDLQFGGFFGCIQSVRPNQVSELDLDHPTRAQRKEPGCSYSDDHLTPKDRVLSFRAPAGGYLKVRGVHLDTESTFSFNLRTRSKNAVLVYQSGHLQREELTRRMRRRMRKRRDENGAAAAIWTRHERAEQDEGDDQSFLAFYLYNGRLIVHLGTDSQERLKRPLLSSSQSYNDGLLHSVFLSRLGKQIQVRIDDHEVMASILDDKQPIGSVSSSMLFGGFPARYKNFAQQHQEHDLGTTEPLIGCLSDFQVNYEPWPVMPEEHQGATFGACSVDEISGDEETENGDSANEQTAPNEGNGQNFKWKKSKQLLEHAAPTFTSSALTLGTDSGSELSNLREFHSISDIGLVKGEKLGQLQQCSSPIDVNSDTELFGNFTSMDTSILGVRFGVSESSHSRINFVSPEKPNPTNFKLSFEFRTSQKKALLWAWASYKNYTRYFHLTLERGFLTLEIKGHREPKIIHYKARRLNDAQWHQVELIKQDKEVRLRVDDLPEEIIKDTPNPKVMKRRMYVGGVISKHRKLFDSRVGQELGQIKMPPGLSGCIRQFHVDGTKRNLFSASRDLVPCTHSREVHYVHDAGFTTFAPLKDFGKAEQRAEVEFGLSFRWVPRPNKASDENENEDNADERKRELLVALLSTTDNNYQKARLGIYIENATLIVSAYFTKLRVQFEEHFDDTRVIATTSNASLPIHLRQSSALFVCPGHWHRLTFRLGTRTGTIALDDSHVEFPVRLTQTAIDSIRALPIHIAGTNAPVSLALGAKSTFGCFRQLELSGVPVSVESARKKHKVIIDGCPFV